MHVCVCEVASAVSTLCNPVDCSPPGSSAHGILQASILEWAAMPLTEGFPDLGIEPVLLWLLHCRQILYS